MVGCPSGGRDEADGDRGGLVADDGADDGRPVPVVLGVVRGVDARVGAGCGVGEGDVAFHAPGADPPRAAGLARRYQGLSCPYAERTYTSSPARTTHMVTYGR